MSDPYRVLFVQPEKDTPMKKAIPKWVYDFELTAVGTIGAVCKVDRKTVDTLFAQADMAYVRGLARSNPDSHFELLVGDEITSLWFGGQRVAVVNTP